jgi:hypothetical protein
VSAIDSDDLERLADHVAGLLDPAEEARVARLVATDPVWARAYADLVAVQPRLDAALAGLGGAVPVPVDVADRLDAALAAQARTATVVDLQSRRERRRFATALTAVAAAAVLVVGGVTVVSALGARNTGTASLNSGGASVARPQAGGPLTTGAPPILHTGTDYTPGSLAAAGNRRAAPGPAAAGAQGSSELDNRNDGGTGRLDDPVALNACLDAIVARYGGQPTLVDFARFQGRAAVIVVLSSGSTRRVVAAGTDCGLPEAGPAVLYSVAG